MNPHDQPIPEHTGHAHGRIPVPQPEAQKTKIVLVGNPNVGKSVLFNYLSGLYVDVSNFPGTTIEISKAQYLEFDLYDTPGIYGVSSFNDEERAARDIILNGDIIVNIVDAVHLERDLFLTEQLIDMGKKVALVVNMMDEAKKHQMHVDLERLETELGVPALGTCATKKDGLEGIHELIRRASEGRQSDALHSRLHAGLTQVGSQAEALLLLEGDPVVAERHGVLAGTPQQREQIYIERRNRVNRLLGLVLEDSAPGRRLSQRLGALAVHPVFGLPVLALVLYVMYLFVGVFVSQQLVAITEKQIGRDVVERSIKLFVSRSAAVDFEVLSRNDIGKVLSTKTFRFPEGTLANHPLLEEALLEVAKVHGELNFVFHNPWMIVFFGEFGAVTMTLTYLLFLLLPLVYGFYLALSVLEDTGYLPRVAALVDRLLRKLGLNGRAVIPIILGFGCVTMATITTRLLGTQREKTIATTILQLAIPCSAQLGVIVALLTGAGMAAIGIYSFVIVAFLVAVGTILNKTLEGEPSALLIDLPPMRVPQIVNVFRKTTMKTIFFMKEASPWFFIGALVVSGLQVTNILDWIVNAMQPLVVTWLKLPKEAATAFVMGLVRRDFGAAGLYHMILTPYQIVTALITITLFVPCIASLMVMFKERGFREGAVIWVGSLVLAIGIGGIVAQILI
jgi:ferrous iron transport protein B